MALEGSAKDGGEVGIGTTRGALWSAARGAWKNDLVRLFLMRGARLIVSYYGKGLLKDVGDGVAHVQYELGAHVQDELGALDETRPPLLLFRGLYHNLFGLFLRRLLLSRHLDRQLNCLLHLSPHCFPFLTLARLLEQFFRCLLPGLFFLYLRRQWQGKKQRRLP